MILEVVFKYVKEHGPCDAHDVAENTRTSEKQCLNILLELQTRGVIKQEVKTLDGGSNSCLYSAHVSEFRDDSDYCTCKTLKSLTSDTESNDFGYWDTCCVCGKHLENGFHYYNHYDGEDHDDIDIWQ